MLQRNRLGVREIRCDLFSLESLARALHIRKDEIRLWIEQGWLQASVSTHGRRRSYTITPESLADAYKRHLPDLLKRGIPNQSLFEAYVQYVHSPKHTVGEQLLDVRRDKRERAAYAAINGSGMQQETPQEEDDNDDDDDEEEYRVSFSRDTETRNERVTSSD
jgi:DNA-binding transcriptional MerR regulator